ncbi:four and a half LIM domains protein 3 [Trichonephila inaurata madagascariensis]|uniref:Four and a half LIM domains protein 3 n=1 Tax=Trichonephila inaurata madagascariensis TaxID=2747483 RepID=A0A8X7BS45_9ARAC|nr:four and a half LIM domains protein 3 [Trichonephila inaurata madagascariensis]
MSKSENDTACQEFKIHSRRKVCRECKQPKENHLLSKLDVKQIHNTLASLAKECGAEESKSNSTYAWVPPQCPDDRVADYFRNFPKEKVRKIFQNMLYLSINYNIY